MMPGTNKENESSLATYVRTGKEPNPDLANIEGQLNVECKITPAKEIAKALIVAQQLHQANPKGEFDDRRDAVIKATVYVNKGEELKTAVTSSGAPQEVCGPIIEEIARDQRAHDKVNKGPAATSSVGGGRHDIHKPYLAPTAGLPVSKAPIQVQ
jgi:hypothetical protein